MPSIPVRNFGNHRDQISVLGLGGHHLGDAEDEKTAVQIVHEAVDGGVIFFDNCWEYNRGKSENWMGKGLKGRRGSRFSDDESVHSWPGRLFGHPDAGGIVAASSDRSSRFVADSWGLL
jgi:predicted aldo/keto reductase-like oxidoreductase